MKDVTIEGLGQPVCVKTNKRIIDALLQGGKPPLMACGGKGLCATCHVFVDAEADALSPQTPRERASLAALRGRTNASRLACQAKVRGPVRVRRPDGRFIEAAMDVESFVGKRATDDILHPVDGRLLIERGKLITRSRIVQLKTVDVDVGELKKRCLTVV
ncbi:MAG: 2Fe-2S iron-sulfur cluster-binding protein [Myxococcota bacterium]